jgi:hypothetical protein
MAQLSKKGPSDPWALLNFASGGFGKVMEGGNDDTRHQRHTFAASHFLP